MTLLTVADRLSDKADGPVQTADDRSQRVTLWWAMAVFAGLSLWMAISSKSDIEMDATTHYMQARFALDHPDVFVDVWARPLCKLVYVLPATLGREIGVRMMSLAMALVVAVVTLKIAQGMKARWPVLAVLFLFAQPVFFIHSFSCLTEIPFAVLLGLAFWEYQKRRFWEMAALASILPLGRPEGFGFVAVAAVALVLHKRPQWLPILPIPFLLWSYEGMRLRPVSGIHWYQWVFSNWPYAARSLYGRGPLLGYVARLPILVGPLAVVFVLVGIWWCLRRPVAQLYIPLPVQGNEPVARNGVWRLMYESPAVRYVLVPFDHAVRCDLLTALIPLGILVVHSILRWRGWMGSNGELRYLLIAAPFWALLGMRGMEWVWTRYQWKEPLLWAGRVALLPLAGNLCWHYLKIHPVVSLLLAWGFVELLGPTREEWTFLGRSWVYRGALAAMALGMLLGKLAYTTLPLEHYADRALAEAVTRWYKAHEDVRQRYPYILSTPPGVWFSMDLDPNGAQAAKGNGRGAAEHPAPGTILIWDEVYALHNSSQAMLMPEATIATGKWVRVAHFQCETVWFDMYLSPMDKDRNPTVWNKPLETIDVKK